MKFIAYLAGPITGTSYGESTDWRETAREKLGPAILGMSPLRAKDYLKHETSIGDSYEDSVLSCSRGIMTRDFNDCQRADILIVNLLDSQRVSIGTVMEIAWAYSNRIPVIAIMEPAGNLHDHAMIREAIGFRVTTLDEAIEVARAVLLPHSRYAG
jgi:nucleoside 2-deoxyribosyltransferase